MPPELLLPAYLAVGTAVGVWSLWREERRPGDRLPALPRLGVWGSFVGQAAVWWLPALAFAGLAAAWRRACGEADDQPAAEPPPFLPPPAFPTDAEGRTVLGEGGGRGAPAVAALFTLVAAGMLFGCWEQERELNAFSAGATAFLAFVGTVPAALILRQWRAERGGLRVEHGPNGDALVWTECPFWTPRPRRLPLADVDRAASWESDPIDFARGVALVLNPRADGLGNIPSDDPRAAALMFPGLSADLAAVPPGRLVLWADDRWDWNPAAALAWLHARGVPGGPAEPAGERFPGEG